MDAGLAPTRKLWIGSLTRDVCSEAELVPVLTTATTRPGGTLPLLRLVLSPERRCAVATFGSRSAALAAKHYLDGRQVQFAAGPRELRVAWALRCGVVRISDLSPDVTREDLLAALSASGEIDELTLDLDVAGRPTGCAMVKFHTRATAAAVVRTCSTNLLMVGGSVLPPRIAFAEGAVDDDFRVVGGDNAAAPLPGTPAAAQAAASLADASVYTRPGDRELLKEIAAAMGGDAAFSASLASASAEVAGAGTGVGSAAATGRGPRVVARTSGDAPPTQRSKHAVLGADAAAPASSSSLSNSGRSSSSAAAAAASAPAPTRFSAHVGSSHYAAPGSLEFDFAREWRLLQDDEAVERARLDALHAGRRARLLTSQIRAWRAMQAHLKSVNDMRLFTIGLGDPNFAAKAKSEAAAKMEAVGLTAESWAQLRRQMDDEHDHSVKLTAARQAQMQAAFVQQRPPAASVPYPGSYSGPAAAASSSRDGGVGGYGRGGGRDDSPLYGSSSSSSRSAAAGSDGPAAYAQQQQQQYRGDRDAPGSGVGGGRERGDRGGGDGRYRGGGSGPIDDYARSRSSGHDRPHEGYPRSQGGQGGGKPYTGGWGRDHGAAASGPSGGYSRGGGPAGGPFYQSLPLGPGPGQSPMDAAYSPSVNGPGAVASSPSVQQSPVGPVAESPMGASSPAQGGSGYYPPY